ncbi:PREDICTED: receptor-type tyrosine-protein phosphatase C-like, partial [Thamnophis sirtalis]|uniref:Receptor-type tyrosine-protein phosphatase C-like n=1 Tax=Thamnophis sirtalis TaxID=35019 RepID=A0A6I9Y2T6_9SAUR
MGKTTPGFSLTPSRTTPFSPASTFEAKPGSPTSETVTPPVSQAVNFTETSLSKESVAFTATTASLTLTDDGSTPFTPTTGTATNISSALPNTTSIDYRKVCDAIQHSVNFAEDRRVANLRFNGSLDLLEVICASCVWEKKTITLSDLRECNTYNITARFSKDCEKNVSIDVNISDNKAIKSVFNDTTITLSWDTADNCSLNYSYCCFQNGHTCSPIQHDKNKHQFQVLANTNYTCNSSIEVSRFVGKSVYDIRNIKTDYGKPDTPENCSPKSTEESININWSAPQNETNGPIHGYIINIMNIKTGETLSSGRQNNITQYNRTGLKPFTKYTVMVQAYTDKK